MDARCQLPAGPGPQAPSTAVDSSEERKGRQASRPRPIPPRTPSPRVGRGGTGALAALVAAEEQGAAAEGHGDSPDSPNPPGGRDSRDAVAWPHADLAPVPRAHADLVAAARPHAGLARPSHAQPAAGAWVPPLYALHEARRLLGELAAEASHAGTRDVRRGPAPGYAEALNLIAPWPRATATRTIDATLALVSAGTPPAGRLALAETLANLSAERLPRMVAALAPLTVATHGRWPGRADGATLARYASELQFWPLPAARWAAAVALMLGELDAPPRTAQLHQGLDAIAAMSADELARQLAAHRAAGPFAGRHDADGGGATGSRDGDSPAADSPGR